MEIEKTAIAKFGSFRAHFENVTAEIYEALDNIVRSFASIGIDKAAF